MAAKTPDHLADLLGVPRSWVMAHLWELPHLRVGRKAVRFTDAHIAEILATFERRPVTAEADTGLSELSRTRLQRRT